MAYHELHDGMPGADTEWAKANEKLFATPDAKEGAFVGQIYSVAHFQATSKSKSSLRAAATLTRSSWLALMPSVAPS